MQDRMEIPLCYDNEENTKSSVQVLHNAIIPPRSESRITEGKLKGRIQGAFIVTIEPSSEVLHTELLMGCTPAKVNLDRRITVKVMNLSNHEQNLKSGITIAKCGNIEHVQLAEGWDLYTDKNKDVQIAPLMKVILQDFKKIATRTRVPKSQKLSH